MSYFKHWRHVTIHAHCTWLHGDPRGFRSREHRIHSSGDYKNPPPPEEHEGLYRFHLKHSRPATHFPPEIWARLGEVLVRYLLDEGHIVLIAAVTKTHAHILVELPSPISEVKEIVGRAKNRASRAVSDVMPGTIWGASGDFEPVYTEEHRENAFLYIRDDQGADAWKWTYQDPPPPELPPNRAPRRKKK